MFFKGITISAAALMLVFSSFLKASGQESPTICEHSGPDFGSSFVARDLAFETTNCDGYVLDWHGRLHILGEARVTSGEPYFPGADMAREVVLVEGPEGGVMGGYVLDGWGGLHPFMVEGAEMPPPAGAGKPYWDGFDIARDVFISRIDSTEASGWILDGYGAMHPFGEAVRAPVWSYFGFDIAREIVMITPFQNAAQGYILDGFGGLHPMATEPAEGAPYFGFDIARDAFMNGTSSGFVLDGHGGAHPFGGNSPLRTTHPYASGVDSYRAIDRSGNHGLVLRGDGSVFVWEKT